MCTYTGAYCDVSEADPSARNIRVTFDFSFFLFEKGKVVVPSVAPHYLEQARWCLKKRSSCGWLPSSSLLVIQTFTDTDDYSTRRLLEECHAPVNISAEPGYLVTTPVVGGVGGGCLFSVLFRQDVNAKLFLKKKGVGGGGRGSAAQAFETVASSAPQAQCIAGACAGCWPWSTHTQLEHLFFSPSGGNSIYSMVLTFAGPLLTVQQ